VGCIIAVALILALVPGLALADDASMEELGSRASKIAMDQLSFQKGDENVLALTDAGYVKAGDDTTQKALKGIIEATGCNIGDSNLFQVLRPHWKPLWFYFFNRASGEAVFVQTSAQALNQSSDDLKSMPDDEVFSKISRANVDLDYMMNHTDEGNATFNGSFGGNEFSLVGISNVWAKNASFDFIQASAFHDHLCPGVTSGYMLANYVESKLPINNTNSESYKVIACPPWCKDDALQLLWDATVGKKNMFVMALTTTESEALKEKYNQSEVAGIFVRWNSTAKQGDALVLGFNWTKMYELTGTANWKGPSWAQMLVMDVEMMDYWSQPEVAVDTLKEFKVDQAKMDQMQGAGMHPLKVAGVL